MKIDWIWGKGTAIAVGDKIYVSKGRNALKMVHTTCEGAQHLVDVLFFRYGEKPNEPSRAVQYREAVQQRKKLCKS